MKTRTKSYLIAGISIVAVYVFGDFLFHHCTAFAEMKPQELADPTGLLKDNEKIKGASQTMNWAIRSACIMATIFFAVNAGKKFNDENYVGAIGPVVGALIAGTSSYFAFSIMN